METVSNRYLRSFSAIILLILAVRIWFLKNSGLDLFFDEAQYWDWSQNMDWGFYSKPPVVALMIKISTILLGNSEFAVRASSPVIHTIIAYVIYYTARYLYDEKTAFFSGVVYISLPAVSVSSILVSTDPSLLMSWAFAMLFFAQATHSSHDYHDSPYFIYINRKGNWHLWTMAGIFAGIGMLSKYNMLLFFVSALLYLYAAKDKRHLLQSAQFWLSSKVAFAIFLPNIIWNFNNGFVSFLHTKDNANLESSLFHFNELLEFLAAQFGVFGPVFFTVLLIILFQYKKLIQDDKKLFLTAFIIPMFAMIVLLSFLSRAHANWAAPIYISATILVTRWLLERNYTKLIYTALIINFLFLGLITNFYKIADLSGFKLSGRKTILSENQIKDPFIRLKGWRELGEKVRALQEKYPDSTILTLTRKTHAELLYYARPFNKPMVKFGAPGVINDHYDMTSKISGDGKYIYISEVRGVPVKNFTKRRFIEEINIPVYDDYTVKYYVYYLSGYKER